MKKRIVVEIDVPETDDLGWSMDETGINCYNDCVIQEMVFNNVRPLLDISKLEEGTDSDKMLAKYLNKKLKVREGLRIVGWIDSNDNFRKDY